MAKVGVIMATYNGRKRIDIAISSLLEQSYKDFKIIICDDGSTDGTYEYLRDKYKNEKRIFIFQNNEKKGLAYALNLCLNYCKEYEFIARMDDDDYCYPERFEEQLKFLNEHENISFVGSNTYIYDGEKIVGDRILKEFPLKKDLIWNSPFIHPTIMFRAKPLYDSDCYRVSNETTRGQDYDLFMRMYSKGYVGANLQKFLFRYTENVNTKKRRTLKVRFGESVVRYKGYKKMKVIWYAFPFVFKPFLAYIKDLFR